MLRALRVLLIALALVGIGMIAGQQLYTQLTGFGSPPESYAKIEQALSVVQDHYVDSLGTGTLSEHTLQGLLSGLDPHSSYIDARRMERVRESFDAEFDGVGVSYERITAEGAPDTVVVVSVVPGGPSEEAGIRPGDRLLRADDASLVGRSDERVQGLLKGPRGSKVTVTVRRPQSEDVLSYSITRDRIPLNTIDAAYMLDEQTGFIALNRFARTTHDELRDALGDLQDDGMERLVLDLRGNAGGILEMAERVADEFLQNGELIVSAKGREGKVVDEYHAGRDGLFEDGPLMVLVDEHSASASEIVAGALQDHRRALVVGHPTFGKGLVQRQYDLGDGSGLRLTVARFFTPSGRVIQQPYETGRTVVRTVTDSEEVEGGIAPDYTVRPDSLDRAVQRLNQMPVVRDFMRNWMDNNSASLESAWQGRPESFAATYRVPESVLHELRDYIETHDTTPGTRDALRNYTHRTETERGTILLQNALTSTVGHRIFGQEMRIRMRNKHDPTVQAASELWTRALNRAEAYAKATESASSSIW